MAPADQRLEARHLARFQMHDGLVLEKQLAPLDGAVQIGLELHQVDSLVVHGVIEHGVARLAGVLGPVHGDVGVAQQLLRLAVVAARKSDTDTRAGEDVVLIHRERLRQGTLDTGGGLGGLLLPVKVLEQKGRIRHRPVAPRCRWCAHRF